MIAKVLDNILQFAL